MNTKRKFNRYSRASKLFSVIIMFIFCAVFILSCLSSLSAADSEFYTTLSPNTAIKNLFYDQLYTAANEELLDLAVMKARLDSSLQNSTHTSALELEISELEEKYSSENSNIAYILKDGSGNLLSANTSSFSGEYICHLSFLAGEFNSDERFSGIHVEAAIPEKLEVKDSLYYLGKLLSLVFEMRYISIAAAFVSFAVCLASLIFLCCVYGRQGEGEEAKPSFIDKIPLEFLIILTVFIYTAIFVISVLLFKFVYHQFNYILCVLFFICCYSALFFITLAIILTAVNRTKTKTWLRSTLAYTIIKGISDLIKKLGRRSDTVASLIVIALAVISDIVLIECFDGTQHKLIGIITVIITNLILAFILLKSSVDNGKIAEGSRTILSGDLSHKINEEELFFTHKEIAQNINHIGDGLSSAIEDQVKSERLKTELITNVSHDIKTPLTCIINYVDLLSSEEIQSEQAEEYISVLKKQSTRLKKLIEDLIETSKASSGNIPVNLEAVDISILLSQALGEYKDRLESKGLEIVYEEDEMDKLALCDGRLCWRIFDNLFSNASKYALSGTRLYVKLFSQDEKLIISMKNISQNKLNITPDELTERFVRGDSSRNTEGSGLGLSIAKSLAALQNGSLSLSIDGDMFTACVELKKAEQ